MLKVIIDSELDHEVVEPIRRALSQWPVEVEAWDQASPDLQGSGDVVVLEPRRGKSARRFWGDGAVPALAVLVDAPGEGEVRELVAGGVAAVVDTSRPGAVQALAVLCAATGQVVVPGGHGVGLARRLEEPPRTLDEQEERFLALVATRSVESAGEMLGYSRRPAQDWFKALREELGLKNRFHASVAAARWGLLHDNGTKSTK